jgi:hypothetical protein
MAEALVRPLPDRAMCEAFRQSVLQRVSDFSWDAVSRRYLEWA